MSTLTRYKFVKYDTGNGYMREGIEPHPDGMWISYLEYEAHNASQREQLRLANIDQLQTEADLAAMTQELSSQTDALLNMTRFAEKQKRRIAQLEEALKRFTDWHDAGGYLDGWSLKSIRDCAIAAQHALEGK